MDAVEEFVWTYCAQGGQKKVGFCIHLIFFKITRGELVGVVEWDRRLADSESFTSKRQVGDA